MSDAPLAFLLRAAGPIAGGALFWLLYFDLKDALRPEPRRVLFLGFLLGALGVLPAWLLYHAMPLIGLPSGPEGSPRELAWFCVGIVGPIEEGVKFTLAALVLFRLRWFDEPIDGLVYASTVAIGFAAVENFFYAQSLDWHEQLARAFTTPLIHSLFSAIWGIGAAYALLAAWTYWQRAFLISLSLLVSMTLHGLYDAALLTLQAPWLASLIALAIWTFVLTHARTQLKSRRA